MIDEPARAPNTKRFGGSYLLFRKMIDGANGRLRNRGAPKFRHPTFEAAEAEAVRLLGLFPSDTFTVIQEVGRVKLKPVEEATVPTARAAA